MAAVYYLSQSLSSNRVMSARSSSCPLGGQSMWLRESKGDLLSILPGEFLWLSAAQGLEGRAALLVASRLREPGHRRGWGAALALLPAQGWEDGFRCRQQPPVLGGLCLPPTSVPQTATPKAERSTAPLGGNSPAEGGSPPLSHLSGSTGS